MTRRITCLSRFRQRYNLDNWLNNIHPLYDSNRCLLCRSATTGPLPLCAGCQEDLPWFSGERSVLREARAIDELWAVFDYSFPVDHMIHACKFHGDLLAAQCLADLMAAARQRRPCTRPDVLMPMPLHWTRLCRRGYNQAQLLCTELGRGLALPVTLSGAHRVRRTRPQTSLDRLQRDANLDRAFTAYEGLRELKVAIVDDVITTGVTANSLAQQLKSVGCAHVQIWSCAQAMVSAG